MSLLTYLLTYPVTAIGWTFTHHHLSYCIRINPNTVSLFLHHVWSLVIFVLFVGGRWTLPHSRCTALWRTSGKGSRTAPSRSRGSARCRQRWTEFIRPLSRPCRWCRGLIVSCLRPIGWKLSALLTKLTRSR